jgi:hypothetical protein
MEYMAYALPAVSFDLTETRVSGGDSLLYVPSGDVQAFTDAVVQLLDDEELRCRMGREARRRVSRELDWRTQSTGYVKVFDRLTGQTDLTRSDVNATILAGVVGTGDSRLSEGAPDSVPSAGPPALDHRGRRYVDLDDVVALDQSILPRSTA